MASRPYRKEEWQALPAEGQRLLKANGKRERQRRRRQREREKRRAAASCPQEKAAAAGTATAAEGPAAEDGGAAKARKGDDRPDDRPAGQSKAGADGSIPSGSSASGEDVAPGSKRDRVRGKDRSGGKGDGRR